MAFVTVFRHARATAETFGAFRGSLPSDAGGCVPAVTDAHRFETFVRRYQNLVYATAVRLLGNPAEAEDVAQTVFLKAFQRFETIGSSPAAAGWLRTVTRNACLSHLSRYRARWRFFSELEQPDGEAFEPAAQETTEPDGAARHEQLEEALLRLPDHQRVPLVLFHFEDASYQDIANILGVSVGKVKTDIHRGREALRRLLT
jgi:RNA polymerase sigma-70 factor (ECF subfamily)